MRMQEFYISALDVRQSAAYVSIIAQAAGKSLIWVKYRF